MASFCTKIAFIYYIQFLLSLLLFSGYEVFCLGINYGQLGNNLPQPDWVIELLSSVKLTKTRIYDTNPQILTAFANSNVDLIVTVENQMLATLMDPQQAFQWVSTRIRPYLPMTRITGIFVGNEAFTDGDTMLLQNLVPAMVSIHAALVQLGLQNYIKVSSPHSLAVLSNSYPSSAGYFKTEVTNVMTQFLDFLATTNAPFWINGYPYFAYKDDPKNISLDYVLFNRNLGVVDPYTNLHYDNMLYAQVDAIIFAMARLGFNGIEVRVSETGWPSKGDENEIGASLENAATYNRNILRRQLANEGTPLRPNMRLEIYLFALFNEDMKPGPTSERNYGLFQPDGTMAYNVGLSSLSANPSTTSTATISLTSSASKAAKKNYQSLDWMIVCFIIQVFMTMKN